MGIIRLKYFLFSIILLVLSSCRDSNTKNDKEQEEKVIPKTSDKTEPIEIAFQFKEVKAVKPIITKAKSPQLVHEDHTSVTSSGIEKKINLESLYKFPLKEITKRKVAANVVLAKPPTISSALPYKTRENNPYNFKYLDVEQGLKNASVYCVVEDKNGAIWIGSRMGLTKYDGKHFYHYSEKEGLIFNYVKTLCIDHNNQIWIGTFGGGVSKFDGVNFTNYSLDSGLPSNTISSIYEDEFHNIWIGTDGGGACKLTDGIFSYYNDSNGFPNDIKVIGGDKKGQVVIATLYNGIFIIKENSVTNFTEKNGLIDNSILSIFYDKSGNFWFGGDKKGMSKFNGSRFVNYSIENGLLGNVITAINQDVYGNIWIGTYEGGISKVNGQSFNNYSTSQGLNSNVIQSICCAKNGVVWIGTEGAGLAKYSGDLFEHKTTNEGLSANWIWNIKETADKQFYLGTNGSGINRIKINKTEAFTEDEGLNQNVVVSQYLNEDGSIWLGTYENGVSLFNQNEFRTFNNTTGLNDNSVWTIVKDKKKHIWFGTENGLVKYDGNDITTYFDFEKNKATFIYSSLLDKDGALWFGTNSIGVLQYKNDKFYNLSEREGLTNNVISCIAQDSSGNLWFGSQNGGISRLKDGVITNLSENNGLSNAAVLAMVCDEKGNMWFGTRAGINKLANDKINLSKSELESSTNLFTGYGINEGFTGNNCVRNSVLLDQSNKIWWGTTKMLTIYNPKADYKDTVAPQVQINSIKLFSENVDWNKLVTASSFDSSYYKYKSITLSGTTAWNNLPNDLVLPYDQNHLTFDFIGINFRSQEKINYQYMLEGADENWSPVSNSTEADYRNIEPGSYTFKIKAVNKDGYWSEPISYSFKITPPWWQTWWARTLGVLISLLLIYFYIKYRERVLKKRQQELEFTVDERTKEVVNQKHIVEEKQREILDSINYAKRIQHSLLASEKLLSVHLSAGNSNPHTASDYFVFFKPKDIVSGDFYWAASQPLMVSKENESNPLFYLVTADSTGHGVPGAIMSMLNISFLNEAINGAKISDPAEIFNFTRTKIIHQLANDGSEEGGKDGMDATISAYDFKNMKLYYAAANNPLWVIRKENNEFVLQELIPDKMPIGKHDKDKIPFTSQVFDLQKGDLVYTFTDGLPDQFGGPKGKKFMYKQMKELLLKNAHLSMYFQKDKINEALDNWKGTSEQVDDILVIGVKI